MKKRSVSNLKSSESTKTPTVTQSLAVKYRPRRITHLIGQSHIVSQILGMQKLNKYPAAILLEGQYGSGKTTTARIIHYMLNCETRNVCGKCASCSMSANSHPDLMNVNAGKDGKVDDIRSLIKTSEVAPFFNKRIIIIDEAHKLTGAAAEALLVPIEEPKPNTIWILCTTNPEKMLATIRSRCMKLSIKPLEPEDIIKRCKSIVQKEGHNFSDESVFELIADFSNGSMREAISLLESVIYAVASGQDFTKENVLRAFVENTEIDLDRIAVSLVAAVLNNDIRNSIRAIKKSANIRGIISKSRWLLDYCISAQCKCAKFVPYSGRLFEGIVQKEKMKIKLSDLLLLQKTLAEAEMKMNTFSIDEGILLQTAITEYFISKEE